MGIREGVTRLKYDLNNCRHVYRKRDQSHLQRRGLAECVIVNVISGLGEERQAFEHTIHTVSGEKAVDRVLSKANW